MFVLMTRVGVDFGRLLKKAKNSMSYLKGNVNNKNRE